KWVPPGPTPASRQPVEAQLFALAVSTGPTPASQRATSVGSAPAQLPPAFVGPNLSPAKLCRPTFCLLVECTDPAPGGEQPLRTPCLPPRGLSRLGSHLTVASRDQVPAYLPPCSLDRPSSSCTVACFSPIHDSRCPPRGVSACLTLAPL
ncbi:hypothetical protein EGK_13665, partial [Macaca mulatta]